MYPLAFSYSFYFHVQFTGIHFGSYFVIKFLGVCFCPLVYIHGIVNHNLVSWDQLSLKICMCDTCAFIRREGISCLCALKLAMITVDPSEVALLRASKL